MKTTITSHGPPMFSGISRFLHVSTVFCKQPPHDKQRRRRKMVYPFQRNPFYDEDPICNLKLTDLVSKSIPKSWGSTESKVKHDFFNTEQAMNKHSSLFWRLDELYYHEENMWFHRLQVPLVKQETLDFVQHLTRTQILPISKLPPSTLIKPPSNLKTVLKLRLEHLIGLNEQPLSIADMMECAYSSLSEAQSSHVEHHSNFRVASGGKLETFFKRSGYARLFDKEVDGCKLSEGVWEPTSETVLDAHGMVRFNVRSQLAWQLRANRPLSPFVPMDSAVCFEDVNLPQHLYRPEVFGLEPVNAYEFSCVPFTYNKYSSEYVRSVAGYWPDSPYWQMGDPCQFARLGVLKVEEAGHSAGCLLSPPETSTNSTNQFSENLAERDALSNGLLTAFAWASAIAYNQGASLYQEVNQPTTLQLLLVTGEGTSKLSLQSLYFQLNSLTGLWKAEDAGMPFNLAWVSPVHSLYTTDINRPQMNSAALSMLCEVLVRGTSMEADKTASHSHRLIPSSTALLVDRQKVEENKDGLQLSQKEHDALIAVEGETKKQKGPLRRRNRPQPHPNSIFFLRMTEKAQLIKEMREKMPVFGLGVQRMLNHHRETLAKYEILERTKKPQLKVLQSPLRWR